MLKFHRIWSFEKKYQDYAQNDINFCFPKDEYIKTNLKINAYLNKMLWTYVTHYMIWNLDSSIEKVKAENDEKIWSSDNKIKKHKNFYIE
jgi:hypothetical protein